MKNRHTATARLGFMARRWFPPSPRPVDCGYAAGLEVIDDAKQSSSFWKSDEQWFEYEGASDAACAMR